MKKLDDEHFNILRRISNDPNLSQRKLAKGMGLSLGKVNYCLNSLKNKGLVKIGNFRKSKNKIKYLYVLTPKGISEKTKLTIRFMNQKMKEYDALKKEIKK